MLSTTAATGLFLWSKFKICIEDLSDKIFPFHLLGLNGLIGVIANFLEFKDKIGPSTDKLYAVLPAGVHNKTPSPMSFLIRVFLFIFNFKDAVCLLCLNRDSSLSAKNDFLILPLLSVFTFRGWIIVVLALSINLLGDWMRDALNPKLKKRWVF